MQGREYLELAREIVLGGTERHWRGASGRAYYGLMLECRDALFRWGIPLPPRENVHSFTRLRCSYAAHPDLRQIGDALDRLGRLRNRADYDLSVVPEFTSGVPAQHAIQRAENCIVLLDAIDGDAARRAAAVAAVRAAFP